MSNHPMRDFRDTLGSAKAKLQADARNAFGPVDIYPATTAEQRAAQAALQTARPRPVPRTPWPWWAWFTLGASGMLGALGLVVMLVAP